jgi:WD40-like Beta Propeller Repeat
MRGRDIESAPSDVWVMDADGSHARRLAAFAAGPVWSPDSRRIAYSNGSLVIQRVDGGGRVVVRGPKLSAPSWSPDGKRLVFDVVGTERIDLGVVGFDGRGRRIVRRDVGGYPPVWLGSGLIALGPDVFRPDGRVARRGVLPRNFDTVAWAPDGRRFAFTTSAGLRIGVPGGAIRNVTPPGSGVLRELAWSADDRWLAVRSQPKGSLSRHGPRGSILVVAADGSSWRRVASPGSYPFGGDDMTPAWRPGAAAAGRLGSSPARPAPAESASATVLRSAGTILGLAADGKRVAVAVAAAPIDCPHVSVWSPGTRPVHLGAQEPCVYGGTSLVPDAVGLAGTRAAWVFRIADPSIADLYVETASAGAPARVAQVDHVWNSSELCCGGGFAADLHGHGDLLVYDSWTACMPDNPENGTPPCQPDGEPWGRTTVKNLRLWRLDGAKRTLVRSGDGAFEATDADAGRVAVVEPAGPVDVLAADGSIVHRFSFAPGAGLGARLSGAELVVLTASALEVYDAATGAAVKTIPLASATDRTLVDFDGGIAVYVEGRTIHAVRVADGRSTTISPRGTGAVFAQLEPAGLFTAWTLARGAQPGRVEFLRRSELEGRLR